MDDSYALAQRCLAERPWLRAVAPFLPLAFLTCTQPTSLHLLQRNHHHHHHHRCDFFPLLARVPCVGVSFHCASTLGTGAHYWRVKSIIEQTAITHLQAKAFAMSLAKSFRAYLLAYYVM